jgi:hypothetical protein
VRYSIDASDRLTQVDDEWLPFAADNDAASLTPDAVLGRSLYSFIGDITTTHLWKKILVNVRNGRLLDLTVRCDSSRLRRIIRIRASADPDGGVTFETSCLSVVSRDPVPIPTATLSGGPQTLCSWCQRIRLPDLTWVPLEEGISRLNLFGGSIPSLISHGICDDCFARALAPASNESSPAA